MLTIYALISRFLHCILPCKCSLFSMPGGRLKQAIKRATISEFTNVSDMTLVLSSNIC